MKNESWIIENISTNADTQNNTVTIFNRWGSKVWSGKNYDNDRVKFTGQTENGNDLPSGTYFYKIVLDNTGKVLTGYLVLKR